MSEQKHGPSVDPEWTKRLTYGLVAACVVLAASDFFYHKHGHYDFEQWPAFHAWYGALGCMLIALLATQFRKFVRRDEEYYQRD